MAPSLDAETQGYRQVLGRLVPAQFVILRVVNITLHLWEAAIGLTISSRAFSPLTQPMKYGRASTSQPSVGSDAIVQ